MNPQELREAIEYLDAFLEAMTRNDDGSVRSIADEAESARVEEGLRLREQYARDLARHDSIAARTELPTHRDAPRSNRGVDPMEIAGRDNASTSELRDALIASLEERVEVPENMAHAESVIRRHTGPTATHEDRAWARQLIIRSSDAYNMGFWKCLTGRSHLLTEEERTALTVGTTNGASAGLLLPTHIDPTIILTNAGSSNAIRGISRVVTLGQGFTAWNGITSAGVTASWDGEVVEVSDDTPSFAKPNIVANQAQAFVQASVAAFEDVTGLQDDVMMMFADARDRLEGAAHATGSGSGQPKGIFTAVHAVTASRVQSTTAATIGLVDIHSTYRTVPVRWRNRGTWVTNPLYSTAVKALGTAVSASYSGDLRDPVSTRWLDKAVVETDDAPTTQTTTALDDEILYGDFSQYVIVDKPGSMAVEFIPHLFNTANNLPDGRRGWFAWWRNGADAVVTSAFALLVDKTSA